MVAVSNRPPEMLVEALVEALASAWQLGRPLSAETAKRLAPAGPEEAYAVQAALGHRLGWWRLGRPRGWKLAMGEPPKAAPIPDGLYHQSPGQWRDPVSVAGVEVELAVRGWPLQAGDLVATGSWCGIRELLPGSRVIARFADVGEVVLRRPPAQEVVQ